MNPEFGYLDGELESHDRVMIMHLCRDYAGVCNEAMTLPRNKKEAHPFYNALQSNHQKSHTRVNDP